MNHINSMEAVRLEKLRVRERLAVSKEQFNHKLYEIPAELAAAGANSLIPFFLRGKVTNAALAGGKKLINKLIVPDEKNNKMLPSISKGISFVSGLRKVASFLRKR